MDWFSPGYKAGGPIKSILHLVSQIEAPFYIITSVFDHQANDPYPNIQKNTWLEFNANTKVMYCHPTDVTDAFIKEQIEILKPQTIYLNSLFSRVFSLNVVKATKNLKNSPKVILAPRGMLKSGALQVKSFKKRIFLLLSRWMNWFGHVQWHATNEEEAEEIRNVYGAKSMVHVAANLPAAIKPRDVHHRSEGQINLVTVARVSPEKGILEGAKILRDSKTPIKWTLYGVNQNSGYLNQIQSILEDGNSKVQFSFEGEISPTQLSKTLPSFDYFFSPTLGENYGHAIVEALVIGLPVLISDRTPWNEINQYNAGWAISLDQNEEWQKAIRQMDSLSEDKYQAMCKSAIKFAESHIHDSSEIGKYKQMFNLVQE